MFSGPPSEPFAALSSRVGLPVVVHRIYRKALELAETLFLRNALRPSMRNPSATARVAA